MTDDAILHAAIAEGDREAAFAAAADALAAAGRIDDLFDLRMLHAKLSRGLAADRPPTLSEVPTEHRRAIEEEYRDAARAAGQAWLDRGEIGMAWNYFQVIGEPRPIREALESHTVVADFDERQQELAQIALYDRAAPRRGVEMILAMSGMCNTVTAVDHVIGQLDAADRGEIAQVMVRALHESLVDSVRRDLQSRVPLAKNDGSLPKLLDAYPQLLENGQYHVDVSHLAAVVRFARSLPDDARDDLTLAIELCDYGERLDPALRYASEPPFEEPYEANRQFLQGLRGQDEAEREAGLDYFRGRLEREPDEQDKPVLAYVLTDLLMRCRQFDEAVQVAERHLLAVAEQTGFSFAELCRQAGRMDALAAWGQRHDDPVALLNGRFGGGSDD